MPAALHVAQVARCALAPVSACSAAQVHQPLAAPPGTRLPGRLIAHARLN